jgi:hypothetical protein
MSETKLFEVHKLTTYQVAPDGSSVLLKMVNGEGTEKGLVFSIEHLNQLALTMPTIICQALRATYGDPNHRLVHKVEAWKVERGEGDRVILTFMTADNFQLSVAVPDRDLNSMADAIGEYELEAFPGGLQFH